MATISILIGLYVPAGVVHAERIVLLRLVGSLFVRSFCLPPFCISTQTTILYFLADLIWVARVPICVKSPDVIIKVNFKFAGE